LAGRKFGEFGDLSVIHQTKTIQTSTYNYNLLAESIHSPNFFHQMLEMSKFAKLYPCQTFPLYSIKKQPFRNVFIRTTSSCQWMQFYKHKSILGG